MGGSRRVARLAFYWALMGCGLAQAAVAQEAAKPVSSAAVTAPSAQQSQSPLFQQHSQSSSVRTSAPWLSQPFQSAQSVTNNKFNLGDQHTLVVSTLGLILIGVVVLLLVT